MQILYLDNAATTPVDPEVHAQMEPYFAEEFGNPSSRHPAGIRATEALDLARRRVARALGTRPQGVVFTSGGTEANNLALLGLARAGKRRAASPRGHILVGPSEHASVRVAARALAEEGFEVESLRLTAEGALDLDDAVARVRPDTLLVAQTLVQSEVGTIYPVARLARLVRARAPYARVHVDAVQAFGKIECDPLALGADTLALSAHKVHGPKGAGALVVAEGVSLRPVMLGGSQEGGLRAGTQNVPAAVGLGAAVELAESRREATAGHLTELRERIVAAARDLPGVRVLAPGAEQSGLQPSITALVLASVPAEVCMHHLEARGVYVSAGSACQSGKSGVNPTYEALGLSLEEARRVLRVSVSRRTSMADLERALTLLGEVLAELEPATPERSAP